MLFNTTGSATTHQSTAIRILVFYDIALESTILHEWRHKEKTFRILKDSEKWEDELVMEAVPDSVFPPNPLLKQRL